MMTEGEETQGVKRPEAPLLSEESRERVEEEEEEDVVEAPEEKRSRTEGAGVQTGEAPLLTLTELLDGLNSSSAARVDECLDRFMRVVLLALQHQQHRSGSERGGEAAEELVHAYLRGSPQVNELLALWRRAEPSGATARLVVSVLGLLLQANVFADTRPVSGFVARTVTRTRLKALCQLMGDARYVHVVPALRLLTAVVALGPATARDLFQRFDWRADAVAALPGRRARTAAAQRADFDHTQHVRTHYVRFCLAFLRTGSAALVQAVLAADAVLPPLLDGIAADPAPLLRELLGTLARCAVRPPAVPRRLKLRLLTPTALDRLAAILAPRHRLQHPHDHDACARIATAFLQDCFAALAAKDSDDEDLGGAGAAGAAISGISLGGESVAATEENGTSSMTSSDSIRKQEQGKQGTEGEEEERGPIAGTGTMDVQELAQTGAGTGGKKGAVLLGLARALCASAVVAGAQRRTVAALLHHRPALAVAFFRWLVLPDAALSVPWLAATALVLDVLAVLPVVSFSGATATATAAGASADAATAAQQPPPPQAVLVLAAEHTVPLRRAFFARALSVVQPPLVLLRALDVLVVLLRRCQRALAGLRARGAGWALAEHALKSALKARLPSLQALLALRRHCADAARAAHDLVAARTLAALALALQTFPELVAEDGFHTATLLRPAPASPLAQHALLRLLTTAPDFALAAATPAAGRAAAPAPAFVAVCALAAARAHPAMARAAFAGVLRTLRAGAGLFAEPAGALQLACWLARCGPADVPRLCTTLVEALRLPEHVPAAPVPTCTSVVLLEHLLVRAGATPAAADSSAADGSGAGSGASKKTVAGDAEEARALVLRIVPDICLFAPAEVAALLGRYCGDVVVAAQAAAQTPDDPAACARACAALTPAELLLPHSVPTILRFLRLARTVPADRAPEYVRALGALLDAAQKVRHRVNYSCDDSTAGGGHSHSGGGKNSGNNNNSGSNNNSGNKGKVHFYGSCLLCSALCFDDVVFELVTAFGDTQAARLGAPLLPRLVAAMAPCSGPRTGAYLARVVDTLLPLAGAPAKQPLAAALVACLGSCPAPVRQRFVDACMDTIGAPAAPSSTATSTSDQEKEQQEEEQKQELATLLLRNLRPGLNLALLLRHEAYVAALLRAATATPDARYDAALHRLLVRTGAGAGAPTFARRAFDLFGAALAPAWERYAVAAVASPRTRAHTAPAVAAAVRQSPRVAAAVLAAWAAAGTPVAAPHVLLVPALAAWRGTHTPGALDALDALFAGARAERLLAHALPVLQRAPDAAAVAAFVRPFARGPVARDLLARLEHDDHALLALTPGTVAVLAHFVNLAAEQVTSSRCGGCRGGGDAETTDETEATEATEATERETTTKKEGEQDKMEDGNGDGNKKEKEDGGDNNGDGDNNKEVEEECADYVERALVVLLRRMALGHERVMGDELAAGVCAVLEAHSALLPARRLRGKDAAALWRGAVAACGETPRACTFRALAAAVRAVFARCPRARRRHRLAALQDALAPHLAEYADAPAAAQARFVPPLCALLRAMYALAPALCAAPAARTAVLPALARVYGATTARADRALLAVLRAMDVAGCPLATVGFAWGNLAWAVAHGAGGDLAQALLDPASGMIDPEVMARSLENYPFHRVLPSARASGGGDGSGDDGNNDDSNNSENETLDKDLLLDDDEEKENEKEEEESVVVYDPVYMVPVLLRVAAALPPESVRPFLDSGCLQYAVLTLSSPDGALRQAAYAVLAKVVRAVQRATFPDKRQTLLLLTVLRNSVAAPGVRLPLTATAFLVRAASVLRRPDHALYAAVSRFLLARPALALGRVPMFLDCFLQTDPRRIAAHRVWLLRVLAAAAAAPSAAPELRVWQASRVLDTLCAEHANPACDRVSRALVETTVARVLAHWARPPSRPRAALCAALLRWLTSIQHVPEGPVPELELETTRDEMETGTMEMTDTSGESDEAVAVAVCSDTYAQAVVALATRDAAVAQMVAPDLVAAAAVLLRARRTAQGLAVLGAVAAVAPPIWQPPARVALLGTVLARAVAADDVATAARTAAALCALVPPEQPRPAALDALLRRVTGVLPRDAQTRCDIARWLGDTAENDE